MKLLFIGGTGNISTECAAWAHRHGHEVAVVTRGSSKVPEEYRAIKTDRHDLAAFRQALKGYEPEVVLNFLGYTLEDVQLDFELFHRRLRQYIFISSASTYAKPPPRLPIVEDFPLDNPWWEYSRKKIECERWLLAQLEKEGFPVTIVRPSHTYSKLWVPNPVSSSSYTFASRLENGRAVYVPDDGENPWTLTASSDFAKALGGLLGREDAIGEAFHITSDEVVTWNQIVAEIASAVGARAPEIVKAPTETICRIAPQMIGTLKGDKAHPGVFDNSKIKRFVPDFQCTKPFANGVRESIAWLRAHPEQQNLNPKLDQLIDDVVKAVKQS